MRRGVGLGAGRLRVLWELVLLWDYVIGIWDWDVGER